MKTRLFRSLPYIKMPVLAMVLCLCTCMAGGCAGKSDKEASSVLEQTGEVWSDGGETKTVEATAAGEEAVAGEASVEEVVTVATSVGEAAEAAATKEEAVTVEVSMEEEAAAATATGEETEPLTVPEKDDLVRVRDYIPDILVDLKYASTDNFTGQKIYDFTDAYLRYGTIERLKEAQDMVKNQGMTLKIWDAYRPVSAQFRLWEVCPNPTYVANPNKGYSSHSRGNTVDITLVYEDGTEAEMPTGFDDFSSLADRDYSDCDALAAENAALLENIMKQCGFKPYSGEWWHFSDVNSYPVEEAFQ